MKEGWVKEYFLIQINNKSGKGWKHETASYLSKSTETLFEKYGIHAEKMWIHMIILSVIALGVISYAAFCTFHMKTQDAKATREYVANYTEQIANMVQMDVNDVINTVYSLSKAVEEDHAQGDLQTFLDQKQELYRLDFIAICNLEGKIQTIAGTFPGKPEQMENLKNKEVFKDALDKKECAVGISNGYVMFAKDLYANEEKTGTFWVGNKDEKLRDIVST